MIWEGGSGGCSGRPEEGLVAEVDGSEAVEKEGDEAEAEAFSSLRRLWSSASACSSRVRARVFLGIAVGGDV